LIPDKILPDIIPQVTENSEDEEESSSSLLVVFIVICIGIIGLLFIAFIAYNLISQRKRYSESTYEGRKGLNH